MVAVVAGPGGSRPAKRAGPAICRPRTYALRGGMAAPVPIKARPGNGLILPAANALWQLVSSTASLACRVRASTAGRLVFPPGIRGRRLSSPSAPAAPPRTGPPDRSTAPSRARARAAANGREDRPVAPRDASGVECRGLRRTAEDAQVPSAERAAPRAGSLHGFQAFLFPCGR